MVIKQLKNSATEEDYIQNSMFLLILENFLEEITHLYNEVWNTGSTQLIVNVQLSDHCRKEELITSYMILQFGFGIGVQHK